MKKLLDEYERTIQEIEERIEVLKTQKRKERDLETLHKLEWRIDLLKTERLELMEMSAKIKRHLAPKTAHPSMRFKAVSGGN